MTRRDTLLAFIVHNTDRTHAEIVDDFLTCAHQIGESNATLSVRTLRRWMKGDLRTGPRAAQRRVAERFWGRSIVELFGPADRTAGNCGTSAASPPVDRRHSLPPSFDASHPCKDSPIERMLKVSARKSAGFAKESSSSNTGPIVVEQLAEDVAAAAKAYTITPVIGILGDLIDLQERIFTLLEGRQRPVQTRDLYVLAGITTGLLAKASHDLRQPSDAMTQARTAFVCADNADHAGLKTWVLGLQSLIAFWAGRPQEAIGYAQDGQALVGEVGAVGTSAIWLAALEARAAGHLRDSKSAWRALEKADDLRAATEHDDLDEVGGQLLFTEPKHQYYAAAALTGLTSEPQQAEERAAAAVAAYETASDEIKSFSDEIGARAELAIARLQSGQLDGAHEAVAPVLAVGSEFRIGGVVPTVARVHRQLADPAFGNDGMVAELRDELETFCRSADAHRAILPSAVNHRR